MSPRNFPEEDDEDEEKTPRGRPSSYFAHPDPDTFGGSFRGTRPIPHGGQQTVSPEDTGGSMEYCWCGLPFDHDWPGKAGGSKHPRKEAQTMAETAEDTRIERRVLRAYHADLQDLVLKAVNEYQVKYRITANSVILFPPDGSNPYTIHARNGDRQRKAAQQWFVRHCVPRDQPIPRHKERPVDEAAIKELAEAISSEEHVREEPAPKPAPPAKKTAKKAPAKKTAQPEPAAEPEPEWVPYTVNKGKSGEKVHPFYLISTKTGEIKCTIDDAILPSSQSTGGHTRTHHTDTTSLWGPEAKKKGIETYHTTKLGKKVAEAIDILSEAIGIQDSKADVEKLTEENAKLQTKVTELEARIADMEAKAALAREALGL